MTSLLWQAAAWALQLPVGLVHAQQGSTPPKVTKITLFDPLKGKSLPDLLNTILQGLTALAIPVVAIMVMIGSYYIITSGGNPARRTKGKDYILWSAIGFGILLAATSVTTIITNWLTT